VTIRTGLHTCVVLAAALLASPSAFGDASGKGPGGDVKRGVYVFDAAGCGSCHTDPGRRGKDPRPKGEPLAGGLPIVTKFGTYYVPNITPDPQHGIGGWTFDDFDRALRQGRSPSGDPYYPSFPYPSYTLMADRDVADLWAYVKTFPSVSRPDRPHDLDFPYSLRSMAATWLSMYFHEGRLERDPTKSAQWNRGAYLVRAVAHCGECHSPRGYLGAVDHDRALAGNPDGPDGDKVPNITPHQKAGIGTWSLGDMLEYLDSGMLPDGDFVGAAMADVVENSTSKMTAADRRAIAVYLKSLPPIGKAGDGK